MTELKLAWCLGFFLLSLGGCYFIANALQLKKWLYVGMFIPVILSGGLYAYLGAPSALSDTLLLQQMQTKIEATLRKSGFEAKDLEVTLLEIESELGKSALAWSRLSEFYSQMGLIQQAKNAMRKACDYEPSNLNYKAEYLNFMFIEDGDTLSKEAEDYLKTILIQNPKHPGALNLKAVDHFQKQQYAEAIDAWKCIIEELPQDSEMANTLKAAIARAKMLKQQDTNNP